MFLYYFPHILVFYVKVQWKMLKFSKIQNIQWICICFNLQPRFHMHEGSNDIHIHSAVRYGIRCTVVFNFIMIKNQIEYIFWIQGQLNCVCWCRGSRKTKMEPKTINVHTRSVFKDDKIYYIWQTRITNKNVTYYSCITTSVYRLYT